MLKRVAKIVACSLAATACGQDLFLAYRDPSRVQPEAPKPHILFLLLDDLGWAEVGWNRAEKTREVQTPNMDSLVADGINLQRHYVHKFCSPTRCAIQTGRAPIHVNVINPSPDQVNVQDPVAGFAGIPRNMTGIGEVMRSAGYKTHIVGKWDVGMATPDHTPAGRGYDSSLVYFHHSNDCWTHVQEACHGSPVRDLWNMKGPVHFPGKPATAQDNNGTCSFTNQSPKDGSVCIYEDELFEERVKELIIDHNPSVPLFLFWSTRTVHGALQPPDAEFAKFDFIDTDPRRSYHAMVSWIDGAVGRVVEALKTKSMFNNTLIVMSSDNGGDLPVGNNFPHKGGKFSNWEGGIRVAAFVSGGFLPKAVRGTTQEALVAGWDWYATFAGLAGANATDAKAAAAGLPAHDSIDQWPLLSGATSEAPRRRLEIGSNEGGDKGDARKKGATTVGGIIVPPYKLVIGYGPGDTVDYAGWTGPQSPNKTSTPHFEEMSESCGRTPATGCLFDVFQDPSETKNLAPDMPGKFWELLVEVDDIGQTLFSPDRGVSDPAACKKVMSDYHGYWGPWLE